MPKIRVYTVRIYDRNGAYLKALFHSYPNAQLDAIKCAIGNKERGAHKVALTSYTRKA